VATSSIAISSNPVGRWTSDRTLFRKLSPMPGTELPPVRKGSSKDAFIIVESDASGQFLELNRVWE
jgi:hypothetical protein